MVNEVALTLLFALFGWKVALLYLGLGLTVAEYRTKWGLPDDYPLVSPAYSQRRSELAKAMNLGQNGRLTNAGDIVQPGQRGRKAKVVG